MIGLTSEGTPLRSTAEVAEFARRCFEPGLPGAADRVGVELEFLVFDRAAPAAHVPLARVERALATLPGGDLTTLPGGSRVTFEPGGQIELSGPAAPLPDALARLAADVAAVRAALPAEGLVPAGVGLDPVRPARRQLRLPRYDAMAEFLGEPYGALMMCSTASVQINLDLGTRPAVRWERAHALGPVLLAAFANSPLSGGRPCGWMSGRQAVWHHLDRTRTRPVPAWSVPAWPGPADLAARPSGLAAGPAGDPADDWAEYLLDARLMLVREGDGHCRPVRDGSTFRDWLEGGGERRPTAEDLAYHATTVFPPVRPRGWLEIRYLDAQHPAAWPVCVAVTHALVTDDRAADAALAAVEPYRTGWEVAARCGLGDPRLRRAAEACFRAALEALPRLGAGPGLAGEVAAFADRHVAPGRSPAADLMDAAPGRSVPDWLNGEGRQ
ncbi:ergothioneine biosynthesis glutamate--cysteine ligase EgtA [Nonomuraea phyllanthi]|uniref:ergothioneine biosynthesis glutamate--cysteine ligase EgtA n=1 Tax=Nonomuraea phyllanthi TaxID=2219224 RepID=UPI0012931FB0|nr:ergothioneine biosynthesis glutamate--cysteine ligase EgtA [Nonomuraea phyllanthi]QFY06605.1 ergothioneine biosynthesis glutamate--cysteine ligase EgtA [Nonomuraea phyllanthi]